MRTMSKSKYAAVHEWLAKPYASQAKGRAYRLRKALASPVPMSIVKLPFAEILKNDKAAQAAGHKAAVDTFIARQTMGSKEFRLMEATSKDMRTAIIRAALGHGVRDISSMKLAAIQAIANIGKMNIAAVKACITMGL